MQLVTKLTFADSRVCCVRWTCVYDSRSYLVCS